MYRDAVILDAGPGHHFDLTVRTLVMAPLGPSDIGSDTADLGLADRQAGTAAVAAADDRPVLECAARPTEWTGRAALLIRPSGRSGPGGAVAAERDLRSVAAAAGAAAIPPASIVLDMAVDSADSVQDASDRLAATESLAKLGHPVSVAVDTALGSPVAVAVSAIMAGARILRINGTGTDVRTVRRAADLTEALLVERNGAA